MSHSSKIVKKHQASIEKKRFRKTQDRINLQDWYAEWEDNERQNANLPWNPMEGSGLLLEPAQINLASHFETAQNTSLNYLGRELDIPEGAKAMLARWHEEDKQAEQKLRALRTVGSKEKPILIDVSPVKETFVKHKLGSKEMPIEND